jgi:hypothetical protein
MDTRCQLPVLVYVAMEKRHDTHCMVPTAILERVVKIIKNNNQFTYELFTEITLTFTTRNLVKHIAVLICLKGLFLL